MTNRLKKTDYYPILCAWCIREGRRTVLNYSAAKNSHGICPRHAAALQREAAAVRREEVSHAWHV